MALTLARLRPLDPQAGTNEEFIFFLNPSSVTRTKIPVYANAPVAGWDMGPYPSFQWVSNSPEEIRIEFMVDSEDGADGHQDEFCGIQLGILDRFMQKTRRDNEPTDLIFSWGNRSDTVRIFEKTVHEKLWFENLAVRQAIVNLTMRTTIPRPRQVVTGG